MAGLSPVQIMRLPWALGAQGFEMGIAYHQRIAMLVQEEAYFRSGGRVFQQESVFQYLLNIYELNRF